MGRYKVVVDNEVITSRSSKDLPAHVKAFVEQKIV